MSVAISSGREITVAIVTFNGGALVTRCVESVIVSGVAPNRIVLVDNGSRDDSLVEIVERFPEVIIIRLGCNGGFARAANIGLLDAVTEWGIVLNNDALLSAETLKALDAAFAADPLLAIAGGQLVYPDGGQQNSIAAFPRIATEVLPKPMRYLFHSPTLAATSPVSNIQYVESTIGALFAVRMSQFRELNGFDQDYFFYLEETDLCKRAWDHGFRVAKVANAEVVHIQGATAKSYAAAARIEFQRSKLIYFRKHSAPAAYLFIRLLLPLKSAINALGSLAACVATLFLSPRARGKAHRNLVVFAWYLLLCPMSWGLPDKCPPNR
jgi:GT2 family glycosyltransferase